MASTTFRVDKVLTPEQITAVMAVFDVLGEDAALSIIKPELHLHVFREGDVSFCNPRDDVNLGVMYCRHRRYTLGDENAVDPEDLPEDEIACILPIYMYDHSGLAFSHTPFSCRWDSGQLGYHYITHSQCQALGVTDLSPEFLQRQLNIELETYDAWQKGDVFGFKVLNEDDDVIEACGGFIGDSWEKVKHMQEYYPDEFSEEQWRRAWEVA